MLTLAEIRQKLGDRNLSEIARRTGLSYRTVWKYARGRPSQPHPVTLEALSDYLTDDVLTDTPEGGTDA